MHELLNNLLTPFLFSLLIAVAIGLVIGIEREFDSISGKEHFAGIRTFALISTLGCVISYLSDLYSYIVLYVSIPSVFLFVSIFHYSKIKREEFGLITEFSLLLTFFLGVISGFHLIKQAVAVAVIIIALLTLRNKFKETIRRITQEELYAFVRFIVLAFLVLPYLPDKDIGPSEIINLQSIGFVIVIVSSLSFVGYFIIKFFGAEKGILFTAFFGGTFSSTAVTWVFSSRSKENELLSYHYAAGIVIACSVMIARVLAISAVFNIVVFRWLLLPCSLMVVSSICYALYIIRFKASSVEKLPEKISLGNPLDFKNAIMFGLQYVAILFLVYYANSYWGTKGLYISGLISGLSDVDAVNISVSKLSLVQISPSTASSVVLLAVMSNTIFKMGECIIKGSVTLRNQVIIALVPSIVLAIGSIIIINQFLTP